MEQKKYRLGYVPGVYDLFHIGHLNLIRRAKEQSEILLAGVLSDELVEHFKKKKPFIPFEERMAIVAALKDVDKVVRVDFSNTVKMEAWKLYHYDAYFSGDDHKSEWDREQRELRAVGSDIVYLPYTKGTSSTMLKKQLKEAEKKPRLYLFGAGRIGQRQLQMLREGAEAGRYEPVGFLDNQPQKHLTRLMGLPVYRPEDLLTLEAGQKDIGGKDNPEENYFVRITMKESEEAWEQLIRLGIRADRVERP